MARPHYKVRREKGGRFREVGTGRFVSQPAAKRSRTATRGWITRRERQASEKRQRAYLEWLAKEGRKKRRADIKRAFADEKIKITGYQKDSLEEFKARVAAAFDVLGIDTPVWWFGITYATLDIKRPLRIKKIREVYEPKHRMWTESEEVEISPRELGNMAIEDAKMLGGPTGSGGAGAPKEKKRGTPPYPSRPRLFDIEEIEDFDKGTWEQVDAAAEIAVEAEYTDEVPF